MELQGKKIEFDLEEFVPLLLSNKQEGFRLIGERFLNAVMEKEFEAFIGAGKHERSKERVDYRNGHKERQLKTTLGELNLLRPYARSGKFETKLFENYSRIDKALATIIVEGYLKGISTRKVEGVLGELDIELSHATVSNLSHELDELITEFRTSPLRRYYPYIYVDALYLKVFNGSRFVSQAVMVAIGVNEDGLEWQLKFIQIFKQFYAAISFCNTELIFSNLQGDKLPK
ncbi:MAG: transposase [Campylobacteraceae bacterium]|nr:transposase [Campylobacteraceae bacterium]